jgi:hypothetical protein
MGRPVAELTVDSNISTQELSSMIQHVTTNPDVLKAAGLKACGSCKSGLDINILDHYQWVTEVAV